MSFDDDTTVTFERDLLLLLFFAHARVRLARFERKRERERGVVGAKRRSASSYRIDSTPWMSRINFIGDCIQCARTWNPLNTPL